MLRQLLLADNHQMVRQGLRSLLEREGYKVVGEADNGREAVRLAHSCHPDVAILDIAMPGLDGIEAAREIVRLSPRTKTIVLTMHGEGSFILEALRAGVRGYVLKTQAVADLVHAIREVGRGSIYLSPEVSRAVVTACQGTMDPPTHPLTPRERQVLQLVAQGKTTREAAEILGVSAKTAESHRTRMMGKLNIHDTAGLVRYAVRRGLIQA
jgi:DNA-binding NarL/FixJ family response regulator